MLEKHIDKDKFYLYDLSDDILNSLELIYFDSSSSEEAKIQLSNEAEKVEKLTTSNLNKTCSICKISLLDQKDYKLHYKTDFHRLNIKRSINKLEPLNEPEFDKLVEEETIESLSGSDTDNESEIEGIDSKINTIIEKISLDDLKDLEEASISYLNTKSPFIILRSFILEEKVLGVYKSLFTEEELLKKPLETIRSWSQNYKTGKSALFMIGGGHFAGAIFSHTLKSTKGDINSKETKQEQAIDVLYSKTFHRYTTRRKQGRSQSANDNARGNTNSAGSSIRRYNEQALIKEVRNLLSSWKDILDECHSIFIRANGALNRKILVGYEGCVLKSNDTRIKTFPFTTKRATKSELKRAWVKLSYISIVDFPKATSKKKLEKSPKPEIINRKIELNKNEIHSIEIIKLLKKQKAPMLINYLKRNNLSPNFILEPESKYINFPTLLHYSSSQNLHHILQILLVNLKADPTIKNKFDKTAYEITQDPNTKKAFQIARYKLGEDYIDWSSAKVGPGKSKEDFEKEKQIELDNIKNLKKKSIDKELKKRTELELTKPKFSSSGKLGGLKIENVDELSQLSDQQRTRIMREQRARAAEARLKKLQKL